MACPDCGGAVVPGLDRCAADTRTYLLRLEEIAVEAEKRREARREVARRAGSTRSDAKGRAARENLARAREARGLEPPETP